MADFSVRQLAAHEVALAQELFALFRVAFAEEGDASCNAASPSETYLARVLAKPDFHVIVALQEERVIGGLTAYELTMYQRETCELFIYDVAVAAPYRRQGVGRTLLQSAKELCVARDISALYVPALVEDADAVKFYESCLLQRQDVAWFVHEFEG